jgi:hypothetical protein
MKIMKLLEKPQGGRDSCYEQCLRPITRIFKLVIIINVKIFAIIGNVIFGGKNKFS